MDESRRLLHERRRNPYNHEERHLKAVSILQNAEYLIIAAGGDDGVDSKARRSSALQPTPLSPAPLVARVWPRPLRLNMS